MEYSIQELSRLSGVTTRTLRWYDQIGLLKPSRVAESGYRYYGRAEVDRLQDILYYRALGVELTRIKECLDDPFFDRLAALRNHLAALEAELKDAINGLGLGAAGTGGDTVCLALKMERAHTHTAIAPVAINFHCWVARRAGIRIYDDGRVEKLL